jgi:hypothetical protein
MIQTKRTPDEISAIAMQMAAKQNGVIEAMLRKMFHSGMEPASVNLVSSYCQCRGIMVRGFPQAYWSFVEYDADTFMFSFTEGWADRCPHMIGPLLLERSDIDTMPASGVLSN